MARLTPTLMPLMAYFRFSLHFVHSQATSIDYCQALVEVFSLCELGTSSFSALPFALQQSCYCASTLGTLTSGPSSFDNLAFFCASQYATIDVTIASDASVLESACTRYVPASQTVLAPQSSAASLTGAAGGPTATPQNTVSCIFGFPKLSHKCSPRADTN